MIVTDDRVTGCQSRLIFEGDDLIVQNSQNTTGIEELNKAERSMHDERAGCAPDGEQVGRIPMSIVMQLQKAGIWNDDKRLLEWLHDLANAVWKTHPGRFI